jgi:taspase, threonine aspartase, 1
VNELEEETLQSDAIHFVVEEEIKTTLTSSTSFVAVHVGAGFHSVKKSGQYRKLCEDIAAQTIQFMDSNSEMNARDGACFAVSLLENSPLTNAGFGSNLTLDGKIECDASIMDANGFGSVAALSNIKNPIKVAQTLLDAQIKGTLSMGRIVPCMLAGEGAKIWAFNHKLEKVDDDQLKTQEMIKNHNYYKNILNQTEQNQKNQTEIEYKLDTVGAIVLDK